MSRLILAPMEGLADFVLRDVLTRIGGFDGAVSEFVRVSGSVLPRRTYERLCPEVQNGCRTAAGTPMVIQLLGSEPELMGLNAVQAATLSPYGVDLNFGCPAKTVNKSGGGAMLLADPGRAYLPAEGLQPLVRHAVTTSLELEDRTLREVTIHRLLP